MARQGVPREVLEVVRGLLAQGASVRQAARAAGVSPQTVMQVRRQLGLVGRVPARGGRGPTRHEPVTSDERVREFVTRDARVGEPVTGSGSVTETVTAHRPVRDPVTGHGRVPPSKTRNERVIGPVTRDESVTGPVTHDEPVTGSRTRDGTVTRPVTPHEAVTEPVTHEESVTDAVTGGETVTGPVTRNEPITGSAAPPEPAPSEARLLTKLLAELQTAPPAEREALRRWLLSPPAVSVAERRRVRRKTFAWYLPEDLGEAVRARAQAEGVPPSEVAERVLRQARAAGWL